MTQLALATQIRNAFLCTLATLTLAACGGESGSGSAAATSAAADTVTAQQNVGMIDRSQGIDATESSTAVASTSAPSTAAATPASGSGATTGNTTTTTANTTGTTTGATTGATTGTTTGNTTVNTGSKTTPPVKVVTTNGVATLDWMPPTQNSDGSALTNLAGYTVYYGTSPNDLSQSIKVSNPGLSAYTVTGLNSGTWYFAVTSYSSDGVESSRTRTISTTI